MSTAIVWFRNDLRVHDHPALATAVMDADTVIPVFILDDTLLQRSANRTRFLYECLDDLNQSLKSRGSRLIIKHGKPETVLAALAKETEAEHIYYTADYTPYALHRDKAVKKHLEAHDCAMRSFSGRLIVSGLSKIQTQQGATFRVFTPFWKAWSKVQRRELATTPQKIHTPTTVSSDPLPKVSDIAQDKLSPDVIHGGESVGRDRLHVFLKKDVADYAGSNNELGADKTSRLSAYLHFGCVSPREIETVLPDNAGARAWHRQLCWREFYFYILLNFPDNTKQEFQEVYRHLSWGDDKKLLQAWKDGQTGYPIVDAAMRQLNTEGWMHNRGRLIVGSFLTKDLWLDWRLGEQYFMEMLLDGDTANNNGNWQWIASVGVDPAPVFRRLYNPSSQQTTYDPDGTYVRRYVPELAKVPDKYLSEPWTMPEDLQKDSGCIIGKDYPKPIIDHKEARLAALDHYRHAKQSN